LDRPDDISDSTSRLVLKISSTNLDKDIESSPLGCYVDVDVMTYLLPGFINPIVAERIQNRKTMSREHSTGRA
jgi:hypothetical protein